MPAERVADLLRRVPEVAGELDLLVADRRHLRQRAVETLFQIRAYRVELYADPADRPRGHVPRGKRGGPECPQKLASVQVREHPQSVASGRVFLLRLAAQFDQAAGFARLETGLRLRGGPVQYPAVVQREFGPVPGADDAAVLQGPF